MRRIRTYHEVEADAGRELLDQVLEQRRRLVQRLAPRMLGVVGARLVDGRDGVNPPTGSHGVKVMSMELLQQDADAPLRWREGSGHASLWRGAAEASALREFLADVAWGELDVLLVDVPPGVDKIARLLELVELEGALLVTTPSEMSRRDTV